MAGEWMTAWLPELERIMKVFSSIDLATGSWKVVFTGDIVVYKLPLVRSVAAVVSANDGVEITDAGLNNCI